MTTHKQVRSTDEALKLALEALESSRIFVTSREKIKHPEGTDWYDERIAAIKEALMSQSDGTQPAVSQGHEQSTTCGEPVAWPVEEQPDGSIIPVDPSEMTAEQLQRYTTPPTQQSCSQRQCNVKHWVSLSDEEIIDCADDFIGDVNALLVLYFARAFETKLKEKNT